MRLMKGTVNILWLQGKLQHSLSATVAVVALEVLSQQAAQGIAVLEQMMGYRFLIVVVVQPV